MSMPAIDRRAFLLGAAALVVGFYVGHALPALQLRPRTLAQSWQTATLKCESQASCDEASIRAFLEAIASRTRGAIPEVAIPPMRALAWALLGESNPYNAQYLEDAIAACRQANGTNCEATSIRKAANDLWGRH